MLEPQPKVMPSLAGKNVKVTGAAVGRHDSSRNGRIAGRPETLVSSRLTLGALLQSWTTLVIS